ncbi:MAG: asparagine synthetase B family protein [Spirochaetota bacterium]
MCGICGIVDPGGVSAPDTRLITRMIGRLRHRGPDSSGYYQGDTALLGHARLAIIDVDRGGQPMSNEDGSIWITYNGEIYNYIELAEELKAKGHTIKTHCDTEIVVHAFEEWGVDCFNRFNGQWAAALWNEKTRRLLISRDRLGIRPLYYTFLDNRFIFASEIKALFVHPGLQRSVDAGGLAEVFTF